MKTCVNLGADSYDIIIERGAINKFGELSCINSKLLIVTDSGVPRQYAEKIASQFEDVLIYTVKEGEASKNLNCFGEILSFMLKNNFTRKDCVVACGGGVPGDLAGFVSACYMRGIDFYNFPTTVLSQVDSSIGGKTGVDLDGIKNTVGAFHQPKKVIIDPDVLKTLPKRQVSNGLAEAVKMSLTFDSELFELFEKEDAVANIDEILFRAIEIKRKVVEQDEKESGLRMVLNFGHTIGHAVESEEELNKLLHGECVALGMIPMCSQSVRERLVPVLKKLNLKTEIDFDIERAFRALTHDKKMRKDYINAVFAEEVGSYEIKKLPLDEIKNLMSVIAEK